MERSVNLNLPTISSALLFLPSVSAIVLDLTILSTARRISSATDKP